jgi:hypothetical protein
MLYEDINVQAGDAVRFWYRDVLAVVQDILSDPLVAKDMIWAPTKLYDQDGNRVFAELCTGNWWCAMQESVDAQEPSDGSKTIIPLILSSDKIVYGRFSGTQKGWPLYLTVGNIPKAKRWLPSKTHSRLVALMPETDGELLFNIPNK